MPEQYNRRKHAHSPWDAQCSRSCKAQTKGLQSLKEKVDTVRQTKTKIILKQDKMYDAIKDVQHTIDNHQGMDKILEKRINKVEKYQERNFGYLQGSKRNR